MTSSRSSETSSAGIPAPRASESALSATSARTSAVSAAVRPRVPDQEADDCAAWLGRRGELAYEIAGGTVEGSLCLLRARRVLEAKADQLADHAGGAVAAPRDRGNLLRTVTTGDEQNL